MSNSLRCGYRAILDNRSVNIESEFHTILTASGIVSWARLSSYSDPVTQEQEVLKMVS